MVNASHPVPRGTAAGTPPCLRLLTSPLHPISAPLPPTSLTVAWALAQMTSLTLLLLCKDGGSGALVEFSATAGPALLVVASWLTVHSLTIYMGGLWKHFSRPAGGAGAGP